MLSETIRQRCTLVLVVAAAVVPTVLWAFPIERIPNPRRIQGNWVSDVANILRPETEQKLNTLINQLQAANGSEMAVVTVPDSTPLATPKELATTLFNAWGIGQKGKDNGVLFLVSLGDRRVEIETGYGAEALLPDARIGQIIRQRVTPELRRGDFDKGTLLGAEAIALLLQSKDIDLLSGSSFFKPIEPVPVVIIGVVWLFSLGVWLLRFVPDVRDNLAEYLQGLAGLACVRGLGQSVKLHPGQSSREKAWHLKFETVGVMRCSACGEALEPVRDDDVERNLKPTEKAAVALGSLQFRGWRCHRCAPEVFHLRGYESTSKRFEHCPICQELTVISEAPYVIPNTNPPGPNLRITNSHCVNCDYTNQQRDSIDTWIVSDDNNSDGGGSSSSSGGDFGGGSSGGGGAGGDW